MDQKEQILDTCLLAGKIMMEGGSEVYRVEDTMLRIATNAGEPDCICYVTATGIFTGLKNSHYTKIEYVTERSINLEKVVAVNRLSREFAEGKIDLATLHDELKHIEQHVICFPVWLQIFSAGIVSCLLMYLFGGVWQDLFPTFIVGAIGYSSQYFVKKNLDLKFFDLFLASFIIGTLAVGFVHFNFAIHVDHLIIGAVMPLVPGLAITISIRDVLAGHLISGHVRGMEALIIAVAIGSGIATALTFFGGHLL